MAKKKTNTPAKSTPKKTNKGVAKNKTSKRIAPNENDKVIAMLSHLLGLLLTAGWLGPLVIFLIKNDEPGIARENARHSLNFQLSMMLYYLASAALTVVFIGIPILIILAIFALVAPIIGSIKAYEGEVFEYPLEIKFISK